MPLGVHGAPATLQRMMNYIYILRGSVEFDRHFLMTWMIKDFPRPQHVLLRPPLSLAWENI